MALTDNFSMSKPLVGIVRALTMGEEVVDDIRRNVVTANHLDERNMPMKIINQIISCGKYF